MSCAAAMDPAPNAFRGAAALEGMMDLQTAVAASMLPGSRTVIASIFKEIRHRDIGGTAALSSILSLLCFPGEVHDEICDLALEQAEAALKRGRTSGFAALMAGDSAYPPLLACIPDPPPVLWILGDPRCLERPAVAVIGSRNASSYAVAVGERLAAELAERGMVVVSGLARGVDSAAHRGCLKEDGHTIAVLGSGLDRIYPPRARAPSCNYLETRGFDDRAGARCGAPCRAFSASQPDHQWDLARGCRRRSLGEERFAHYCPVCVGTGAGCDGGTRKRLVRPQPGIAQPSEGRRKGGRVCGRYS